MTEKHSGVFSEIYVESNKLERTDGRNNRSSWCRGITHDATIYAIAAITQTQALRHHLTIRDRV